MKIAVMGSGGMGGYYGGLLASVGEDVSFIARGEHLKALKSDGLLDLDVDIDAEASVHEKFYYDLVSENTDDPTLSKLVTFDSKTITDYNESITNKVLLMDDISSQFTGIVTSTGGGVIGTTSFDLFTNGDSLFHRGFNPSSGVSTATHTVSIPRHEFNTGEQLIYKPQTGQSAIGIAATTVPGIGVTNLLPPTIFAIKEDNDLIKVAVAKSFADAGVSVSFVNDFFIGSTINSPKIY